MAIQSAMRAFGASLLAVVPLPAFAADKAPVPAPDGKIADKSDITFELGIQHDGNTARGSAARAAQRGLQRADQHTTPTVSLALVRTVGRAQLGLDASLGYDFYRRNTRLNRERISVAPTATIGLSACDLTLSPSVSRRQSDLAEIADITNPANIAETVTNAETITTLGGRVSCGTAAGLRFFGDGARVIANNSESRRRISSYRQSRYGGGLSYETRFAGVVSLNYNHTINDYPNRALIGGRDDGYVIDSVGVNLERPIGSRLVGAIGASYVDLKPRRAGVASFKSVTWNADLTATIGANLQVHAALARSVQPSLVSDSIYHVDKSYVLDATYAFNELFTVKVGGSIKPRDYKGAGTAFGPALINDERDEAFTTISYARSKHLKFFLDGGYQTRRANSDIYNFNNAYVGLRAQFTL